jgi:hypothetical protein
VRAELNDKPESRSGKHKMVLPPGLPNPRSVAQSLVNLSNSGAGPSSANAVEKEEYIVNID